MFVFDPEHNGPEGRAHGGLAAGRFATWVTGPTRVRLHRPVPVAEALAWRPAPGGTGEVLDAEGRVVASVAPRPWLRLDPFEPPPPEDVAMAERRWAREVLDRHPFPTCFGCGHLRADGSGLALRPGRLPSGEVHATSWRPPAGPVADELVWAALDCPSGAPAMAAAPDGAHVVTGELAVDVLHVVRGGRTLHVVSRLAGTDGRKLFTEVALLDESRTVAVGAATWIALPVAGQEGVA